MPQKVSSLLSSWHPTLSRHPGFHVQWASLSWSNWHELYIQRVMNESLAPSIKGTEKHPYFKLRCAPMTRNHMMQFGQGARAIAYRSSLAQHIVTQPWSNWWDLHSQEIAVQFSRIANQLHGKPQVHQYFPWLWPRHRCSITW